MSFSMSFEDSISRGQVWDALDTLGLGRDQLVYESGNNEVSECYKLYRQTCLDILDASDRLWHSREYFSKDMIRALNVGSAVRSLVESSVSQHAPYSQGDFAEDLPQDFYIVLF